MEKINGPKSRNPSIGSRRGCPRETKERGPDDERRKKEDESGGGRSGKDTLRRKRKESDEREREKDGEGQKRYMQDVKVDATTPRNDLETPFSTSLFLSYTLSISIRNYLAKLRSQARNNSAQR